TNDAAPPRAGYTEALEMTDRLSNTRGLFSATDVRHALIGLRATLVAAAAIATLVSLPGWLRYIEAAPLPTSLPASIAHASVAVPEGVRPATAMQVLPQKETVRHQALAEFLAKRYRVSRDSLERFIRLA